jgi:hypothetical protein
LNFGFTLWKRGILHFPFASHSAQISLSSISARQITQRSIAYAPISSRCPFTISSQRPTPTAAPVRNKHFHAGVASHDAMVIIRHHV